VNRGCCTRLSWNLRGQPGAQQRLGGLQPECYLGVEHAAILPLVRHAIANRFALNRAVVGGVEFMACTITSLIAFAVFGVLAVGFANLPRLGARIRLRAAR
jgi:hypothetical protein